MLKTAKPEVFIFIPTSWIHSRRVYYHIQGWKSHPLDSWQKCSQEYEKKKKLIPKLHGYLWMPVYVHMQMCFCFACVCLRFQAGLADNKWKCSPSTAVFNWSNRPKWARSCCANNKALCSPSPSVGRSMCNNNTLLCSSAKQFAGNSAHL